MTEEATKEVSYGNGTLAWFDGAAGLFKCKVLGYLVDQDGIKRLACRITNNCHKDLTLYKKGEIIYFINIIYPRAVVSVKRSKYNTSVIIKHSYNWNLTTPYIDKKKKA